MVVSSLYSCQNYIENGAIPFINETYIKFVSPAGTNVIDSLGLFPKEEHGSVLLYNSELLSVSGTRMSDGQPLRFNNAWVWTGSGLSDSFFPENERIAYLQWADYNPCDLDKHPYDYDEVYEIRLNSQQLFGSTEYHILRWYAKVNGSILNAYKCELDGKEINLDNDPLYNYRSPYWTKEDKEKSVQAFIEIECK